MNKAAIRNFAILARRKLIEQITLRAFALGITNTNIAEPEACLAGFLNNKTVINQREELVNEVRHRGLEAVLDEAAYTWFNRLIAIRYMEVNDFLPHGVRILSSIVPGKDEPDCIREVEQLGLEFDRDIIYRLQDGHDTEDLFKYVFIKQCNDLGKIMPVVFEKIADYTELLLPDHLLAEGSIVWELIMSISEEDWQDVEIVGWLYQYYISERHDEVVGINRGIVAKEDIPAATQLFTPDWIVRYMLQNTLGRQWLEAYSGSALKADWEFYLEETTTPNEAKQLPSGRSPEDITVFDPCMGSGHILVSAFDILLSLYREAGYSEKDIPRLILEKNLYGLDIDKRAVQLAYFALMMKARRYNRRIFNEAISLNVYELNESSSVAKEAIISVMQALVPANQWSRQVEWDFCYLVDKFRDAKNYGSLVRLDVLDWDAMEAVLQTIKEQSGAAAPGRDAVLSVMPPLLRQGRVLCCRYDVVVTNPPYMGPKAMNSALYGFLKKYYTDISYDLFAAFIVRNCQFAKPSGLLGFMTPFVWMFIKSYEALRQYIVNEKAVQSLIQLEYSAFEDATVPICTFVLRNSRDDRPGVFIKLTKFKGAALQPEKVREASNNPAVPYRYELTTAAFQAIPGYPFAYWAGDDYRRVFQRGTPLGEIAAPRQGLATADNARFLRLWHEVSFTAIGLGIKERKQAAVSGYKWFPYNKGGEFRKWYGNNEYVINWENDGAELHRFRPAVLRNKAYYFRPAITWSFVSSAKFGVRFSPPGFIFDVGGSSVFLNSHQEALVFIAFLCSKVAFELLTILNPTINFQVGNIASLPVILPADSQGQEIRVLAEECILIAKCDWDANETSWDFKRHPLIHRKPGCRLISEAFSAWQEDANLLSAKLQAHEQRLNQIFIDLYGLGTSLDPVVDPRDITIGKADRVQGIKSLLSYAVGCMFGRYSLDVDGLVYAGGKFDISRYTVLPAEPANVLPLTDDGYFPNDIVSRFSDFVRIVFGADSLEQNLDYIAAALAPKNNETSRQTIRRYFVNEFYKDHVQRYQQRPIYWQFDSGRYNGFKALIYMHRYDIDTVAVVRTGYLHTLQGKYEAELNRLEKVLDSQANSREMNEARKKKEKLQKQLAESLQYDQVMAHIAHQKLAIDLDDGVKANYGKFQNVEIPQGNKPLRANLLAII